MNEAEIDIPVRHRPAWLKKLGVAGFLLFLAKGLLWLMAPSLLAFLGFAGH